MINTGDLKNLVVRLTVEGERPDGTPLEMNITHLLNWSKGKETAELMHTLSEINRDLLPHRDATKALFPEDV